MKAPSNPHKMIKKPAFSPRRKYASPHFDPVAIPVEFLILHYTAQSLRETLKIFSAESAPLSCHLIIDRDGRVFELVSCWNGVCHRAFHAGKSRLSGKLSPSRKTLRSFNNFSLGIELVNLNGNFYPYTEAQYQSLFQVTCHLKKIYPKLNDPRRILGHEHIAGFRGKADPGARFHWRRFFKEVYQTDSPPARPFRLSESQIKSLAPLFRRPLNNEKAKKISLILESSAPFSTKKQRLQGLLKPSCAN